MLALLLAAPSLALLPRHSKFSCSRSPAVASRAPPLVAQEGRLRQALQGSDEIDGETVSGAAVELADLTPGVDPAATDPSLIELETR